MDEAARTTRRTYDEVARRFLENTRDRSWGAARLPELDSLLRREGWRILEAWHEASRRDEWLIRWVARR